MLLSDGEYTNQFERYKSYSKDGWTAILNRHTSLYIFQCVAYTYYIKAGDLTTATIIYMMTVVQWQDVVLAEVEKQFGPLS
jgi:hypothetical protein